MREILFKAKRWSDGKWVYGDLNQLQDSTIIHWYNNGCRVADEVDPSTVCEYTGLTDRNGKKVFEGDIVKTKYGRLCVICFKYLPGFSGFDLKPVECVQKAPDGYDLWERENLEFIGSIHDGEGNNVQ